MKSDSLVTLLLSIVAITFGIINARKKKKQALTKPRQVFFETESTKDEGILHEPMLDTLPEPETDYMKEAVPSEVPSVQEKSRKSSAEKLKEMGFDAKKAVLFSEILKPKF